MDVSPVLKHREQIVAAMKRFCIFMERMYVLMKHECFRGLSDDSNGHEKPGRAGADGGTSCSRT
jgi:hypothetical protein